MGCEERCVNERCCRMWLQSTQQRHDSAVICWLHTETHTCSGPEPPKVKFRASLLHKLINAHFYSKSQIKIKILKTLCAIFKSYSFHNSECFACCCFHSESKCISTNLQMIQCCIAFASEVKIEENAFNMPLIQKQGCKRSVGEVDMETEGGQRHVLLWGHNSCAFCTRQYKKIMKLKMKHCLHVSPVKRKYVLLSCSSPHKLSCLSSDPQVGNHCSTKTKVQRGLGIFFDLTRGPKVITLQITQEYNS